MSNQKGLFPKATPSAVIVQQGKVLDFIDGETQRTETPEEYVRQEISKSLVREYGYPKEDIGVEFTLRVGTRKPRADLVVFKAGYAHRQENAYIIVECKVWTSKYLNNLVGQDHRRVKQRIYPMLGFKNFRNAVVTISGIELVQKIRKGQYDTSALTVREGTRVPHMWEAVLAA